LKLGGFVRQWNKVPHKTIRDGLALTGVAALLALTDPATPYANSRWPEPVAPLVTTEASAPIPPLAPTIHPPIARDVSALWMVPSDSERSSAISNSATGHLQAALKLYAQDKYEQALAGFVSAATTGSPLANYAKYYAGVSELRLKRFDAAKRRFAELKDSTGFLSEAAVLGEAEAAQGVGDYDTAANLYERLLRAKPIDEPAILLSLATAATASNERKHAAEAYLRLYYEYPLSEFAPQAEGPLQSLTSTGDVQPIEYGNTHYKLELGRAERLFGSRRHADARVSFLRLKPYATGDDAELVGLRLAEIEYFSDHYRDARQALEPYLDTAARRAEARFFNLMAQRGLKNYDSFVVLARALANDVPESSWAEEALNNLATYYIQQDDDDEADVVLREMYGRFPKGRYAERAAWKIGWRAYRAGNMGDAAQFFESAAGNFARSDYRPAWLYWSARARQTLGDNATATARYQLVVTDYQNTYYGRLATKQLAGGTAPTTLVFVSNVAELGGEAEPFPPNAAVIRALLAVNMYDPALKELEFAQKKWGASPAIDATVAWLNWRRSFGADSGMAQLLLARGAMNQMKRAYPQYMAAGGEQLPREILTTIFPLTFWDLIRKYSAERELDPYLVAALVAQESTFVPTVRSHANAYGLMQLLPSTGRTYARKLKLRYSPSLLTSAEPNIRMGVAYFADKVREFGSVPLALASYNAGESPVRRWLAERDANMSQEEFIDDIPYPETQNYVKRILGTAEDYRRLYSSK
jgi:soluble lytic murein transglycosylase